MALNDNPNDNKNIQVYCDISDSLNTQKVKRQQIFHLPLPQPTSQVTAEHTRLSDTLPKNRVWKWEKWPCSVRKFDNDYFIQERRLTSPYGYHVFSDMMWWEYYFTSSKIPYDPSLVMRNTSDKLSLRTFYSTKKKDLRNHHKLEET
jgi:hypothetical protein